MNVFGIDCVYYVLCYVDVEYVGVVVCDYGGGGQVDIVQFYDDYVEFGIRQYVW